MLGKDRTAALRLTLPLVIACVIAMIIFTASGAYAAPCAWDGGHDALGASEPGGTAYFAEGTTRNGFEEYLLLRNPGADVSNVTIQYVFSSGEPKTQTVNMEPWAGQSICVNDVVGPDKDVSVSIKASVGIIAERQIYFNYKTIWTGGSAVRGVEAPRATWFFAEGTTRAGFQEWLCLQNPATHEVAVDLAYMLAGGETRHQGLTLAAGSRKTVDVNAALGAGQDASIKVGATGPIIAERPMYFDYKGAWRGGHSSSGSSELSSEWHFAEGSTRKGFEEWLTIMNPGETATTASVQYLFPGGDPVMRDYPLAAHSRTTLFVNAEVGPEKDVSVDVTTGEPVLCERPMYFCYHGAWEGGHDVVGATAGERTWYFPTAGVGKGFESWLCVSNPGNAENKVVFELYGYGGDYNSKELTMAPHSRTTFDVSAAAANIRNPWIKVSGTKDIIAERPTYFSYTPKGGTEPFTIAKWNGIDIKSPIKYEDSLGPQFHEAGNDGSNCPAMQPYGRLMQDDNPTRLAPGITLTDGNDPAYYIESTRSRGTYSTTACDVHSKTGATVYSPVNGTVVVAKAYQLYGQYPDLMVKIVIDGHADYQMECLHMSQLLVAAGQRVEAGKTPIGLVRDLVPYFFSGPNPYTREEGNHSHIQINYAPPGAGTPAVVGN